MTVKIGTITPEGGGSINCYACDDDVSDPNLKDHLHTFGIDITKTAKTEKTMTELNLEANLAMTLSKVLEAGQTLVPVFGPMNTGM